MSTLSPIVLLRKKPSIQGPMGRLTLLRESHLLALLSQGVTLLLQGMKKADFQVSTLRDCLVLLLAGIWNVHVEQHKAAMVSDDNSAC